MNNLKNIIFDLDGTLIDSSDGVVEAVNYSLEQLGEPTQPPEKIKPFIGFSLSKMYPHFSDKPVKELYHHFQVKAADTVVSSTVILPDVEEVIVKLFNSGYNLAIASTKIRPHIEGIIEKFNWHNYFPVFSGGNEVEQVKPAPDIFNLTMERMKAEPDSTVVVGDTINDIIAAQAIGLKVIGVKSPYDDGKDIQRLEPDYYIGKIKNLMEVLSNGKR